MKLLFAAVNAKYVHTNLAVRYLSKVCSNVCDVSVSEYSINDNLLSVERDIVLQKPDAVAFSCYIWNIDLVLTAASNIKKALPDIVIILGGPEVSYDSVNLMDKYPFIDYVVKGEAELSFVHLAKYIADKSCAPSFGVTYRKDNKIIDTPASLLPTFSDIPFPYTADEIKNLDGRIIYYESSRGCPYSCKYCLSGENGKVRFKDVNSVKEDLSFFAQNNVPLVKFVDRTFNADRKRAKEIWQYISNLNTQTRFHMEITGELLDSETIELLKEVNPHNLQFEIGVQSTNPHTLSGIDRACKTQRLFENIAELLEKTNIHIHLDLIAGLPYEDYESFKKSFNDVISLKPHVLQLGFLKMLKGSAMRNEATEHGMIYRDNSPYEIISNKYISAEEIIFLKDIDYVFDKIYNSGSFKKTCDFLFSVFDDKFALFEDMVNYFRENNYIGKSFSKAKLYDIVYECFSDLGIQFEEALRYDLILSLHAGKLPYWCNTDNSFTSSETVYNFLKDEELKTKVIPHYVGRPAKAIIKHVRFEKFSYGILMFDYKTDKVYDVTDYIN